MALAAGEAGASQRHSLVERHPVADLGRLPDHDTGAMVDEELTADVGRRKYLDPGRDAREIGKQARDQGHAGLLERVCDTVRQNRMDARVAREDLERPYSASSRIALANRGDVLADLTGYPSEHARSTHKLPVYKGTRRATGLTGEPFDRNY